MKVWVLDLTIYCKISLSSWIKFSVTVVLSCWSFCALIQKRKNYFLEHQYFWIPMLAIETYGMITVLSPVLSVLLSTKLPGSLVMKITKDLTWAKIWITRKEPKRVLRVKFSLGQNCSIAFRWKCLDIKDL